MVEIERVVDLTGMHDMDMRAYQDPQEGTFNLVLDRSVVLKMKKDQWEKFVKAVMAQWAAKK